MIAQRATNQAMQKQASNLSQNNDDNKMIPIGMIKPIVTINKLIVILNNSFLLAFLFCNVLTRLITSKITIGNVSTETISVINDAITAGLLFIIPTMSIVILILRLKLSKITKFIKL